MKTIQIMFFNMTALINSAVAISTGWIFQSALKNKNAEDSEWIFGIYNVYNHQNPFAYHYRYNYPKTSFKLKSISVFQITPFFSYEFKF